MQDDEENYLRLDSDRIGENIVIELFKMADEFADIQDKIENSIKKDYYSYGRLNDVKQTYEKISKFDVDEFIKLLSKKYPSEVTEDVKSSLKWIDRIFQKAIAEDKEIAIVQS